MAMLILALVVVLVGALLVWWAVRSRETRGLGPGKTVALDNVTLFSERLRLVGRPDRIERRGDDWIPEEWKPTAKRVNPGHRLQLGAYFLLVEEEFGVRPPFGVVVIRDGVRVEVPNTEGLRSGRPAIVRMVESIIGGERPRTLEPDGQADGFRTGRYPAGRPVRLTPRGLVVPAAAFTAPFRFGRLPPRRGRPP